MDGLLLLLGLMAGGLITRFFVRDKPNKATAGTDGVLGTRETSKTTDTIKPRKLKVFDWILIFTGISIVIILTIAFFAVVDWNSM